MASRTKANAPTKKPICQVFPGAKNDATSSRMHSTTSKIRALRISSGGMDGLCNALEKFATHSLYMNFRRRALFKGVIGFLFPCYALATPRDMPMIRRL